MRKYAEGTTVSPEKSRDEIERTVVKRYGATGFMYGWQADRAVIQFVLHDRRVKIEVALPSLDDPEVKLDKDGYLRTDKQREKAQEAEYRRKWRVLLLVLKARLEELNEGTPIEYALTPWILLPNGQTLGEIITPDKISRVYATGEMPPLLPE